MTITEITAQVVETKSAHLLRYRSNSVIETGTAQYDCKPIFTGSKLVTNIISNVDAFDRSTRMVA